MPRPRPLRLGAALLLALLAGCGGGEDRLTQDGPVLGDGDVLLAVFTSVGCGQCATFDREVLPPVTERYLRTGKARVRAVLLVPPDDAAARTTAAIRAAGLQDRFFDALSAALRLPQPDAEAVLRAVPGLDVPRALADLDSPEVAAAARADRELAEATAVEATPTLRAGTEDGDLRPFPSQNLSLTEVDALLQALTRDR